MCILWNKMANINIWPCRQMLSYLSLLSICILCVRSNNLSTKFNIVLKTPDNTSSPTTLSYKSVHVKYTLQNDSDRWNIVGFEPQIRAHKKLIERLTVHLCDRIIYQPIWYDDSTVCDNDHSILIYEWTPHTSLAPFRLSDDTGFEVTKSKTIILSVTYRKERQVHKEQSVIVLYISTQPSRFKMGTMFVGNKERGTRFSCRSSTVPRLLFGAKKLIYEKNSPWWRMHIIRIRQFGRKLVQSVLDSKKFSNRNQTNIEIISSDLFLMAGDYLLIECGNISESNCYFLIYYMFKSKPNEKENFCQNNEFPNLFKLIPSYQISSTNRTRTNTSWIDGSTIFLIVVILLFVTWISIIIGCIIMRRIRGLVNFRTETSSPLSSQKNRLLAYGGRGPTEQFNQRTGDADHIMQVDAEHAGS